MGTFDGIKNVPDVKLIFCEHDIYNNMSIFIYQMLCKLTAIFICKIYEKIRQVKSSTLFPKLYLPIATVIHKIFKTNSSFRVK